MYSAHRSDASNTAMVVRTVCGDRGTTGPGFFVFADSRGFAGGEPLL
jgi:hypothetical protein